MRSFGWTSGLVVALVGAVAATVIGLLTFGAQATTGPQELPLAVSVPAGAAGQALEPVAQRVAAQGGDAVDWRVSTAQQGRALLDDKSVYGVLELAPDGRGVAVTAVVSGALNPAATQVAHQVLTTAGSAVSAALAPAGTAPAVVTVHPTSLAAKTLPLAASALLWLGTLVTSVALVLLASRGGRVPTRGARLAAVLGAAVLAPAVVLGFAWLWDRDLAVPLPALGFLVLVAAAFAALQCGVLRLLGLPGVALLAPLYLMAPAVAGQPPELLHPAYRALLWSWTPFRFSTETLRSLLFLGDAADVRTGVVVFAVLGAAGLVVSLWPARRTAPSPLPTREPVAVG